MDKRVKRGLRAARPKYQDGGSLPFVSIPPDDLAKAQADPHRYERFLEPIAAGVKSLGDLVRAPFDMARDARQAGGYSQLNPTDVGRAGLNTGLGTLMPAVGGVGGRGGAVLMSGAGPIDKGIKAYHGSPHDFDRFDMSKIGTGEGAQAYGHGLYFAQDESVARHYRDAMRDMSAAPSNVAAAVPGLNPLQISKLRKLVVDGASPDQAAKSMQLQFPSLAGDENAAKIAEAAKGLSGRLYEVRIDADPNDFLDWDKPLSQQSEKVRSILADQGLSSRAQWEAAGNEPNTYYRQGPRGVEGTVRQAVRRSEPEWKATYDTLDGSGAQWFPTREEAQRWIDTQAPIEGGRGAEVYQSLRKSMDDNAITSQLREAGIPGIKYLDAGSRTAGEGSRNYVLFRDDIIQIVRKYGMAAAVSMYGADAVNDALQPMTGNDG